MFYRLTKLIVLSGLLCLASAAKAKKPVTIMHEARLTVRQCLHAEIFAEENSLASVLNSQLLCKQQVTVHAAFLTVIPVGQARGGDRISQHIITSRNDQVPRKLLLILFPFHVFW